MPTVGLHAREGPLSSPAMTAPVALNCPSCASPLKADDLHLAQGIATCGYCRALMTIPGARSSGEVEHARHPISMPKRVNVRQTMHGLEITRRWFTPVAFGLLLFCVFWDGFLLFWYGAAFATNGPLAMKLFPLIHVAAGIFITYLTAATFLNSTRITVERGEVKVSHGPLPWPGNLTMRADAFDQLFCKEKINRGKNGTHVTYEIWAALREGAHQKFLSAGLERDHAIFIEQEMERALNLKDRHVSGEMLR
jgi:hypothetical protein